MLYPVPTLPLDNYLNSPETVQDPRLLVRTVAPKLLHLLPPMNVTVQYRRSYPYLLYLPSWTVFTVPIQRAQLAEEVRKPCRAFH